jgi:hypothetical protein
LGCVEGVEVEAVTGDADDHGDGEVEQESVV